MNGLKPDFKDLLQKLQKWIADNRKIVIPVGAGILVLVVILFAVIAGVNKKDPKDAQVEANALTAEAGTEAAMIPLEENVNPEINQLVQTYFQALASGDMTVVEACRNYTEDIEKIRWEKKSNYTETYDNIICYTQKGLLENTYLVYAYYEVKLKDFDTMLPAISALYVCPDENGALYIYDGAIDDNITTYLKELCTQDNVVELYKRVDVKYKEAIAADAELSAFLEELPVRIQGEVGDALAKAESGRDSVSGNTASVSGNTASVSGNEAPAGEQTAEAVAPVTPTEEMVQTTTTVNVRSSDSETADKVGKALGGEQFKRLDTKGNGWSKIEFEGKEAYVKSEFLTRIEGAPKTDSQEQQNKSAQAVGQVTVQETVNIRASASESAQKLGVAYQGDKFDLLMKQADGWSKITYKGQTGYVKSEYVE